MIKPPIEGTFSKPFDSVLELIGNTPMVQLKSGTGASIFGKVEFFNPCSSIKDRICRSMIEAAERDGLLKPGDTVIEPTSGNTGIGLAFICAVKGYKLVLTMPETMSIERRNMLKAFGAELILTEGADMVNAVNMAAALAKEKGYFQPQQFRNPANPEAHFRTTAVEIINQAGSVDAFVAGVGTGGTITGIGKRLKEHFGGNVRIIAVEPEESAVLSGKPKGRHGIQGIGAGFIPDVLDRGIIDEIIQVSDSDAFKYTKRLIRYQGILCGISSGANYFAAIKAAANLRPNQKVVTVLPDTAERYLSTDLFNDESATERIYEGTH